MWINGWHQTIKSCVISRGSWFDQLQAHTFFARTSKNYKNLNTSIWVTYNTSVLRRGMMKFDALHGRVSNFLSINVFAAQCLMVLLNRDDFFKAWRHLRGMLVKYEVCFVYLINFMDRKWEYKHWYCCFSNSSKKLRDCWSGKHRSEKDT